MGVEEPVPEAALGQHLWAAAPLAGPRWRPWLGRHTPKSGAASPERRCLQQLPVSVAANGSNLDQVSGLLLSWGWGVLLQLPGRSYRWPTQERLVCKPCEIPFGSPSKTLVWTFKSPREIHSTQPSFLALDTCDLGRLEVWQNFSKTSSRPVHCYVMRSSLEIKDPEMKCLGMASEFNPKYTPSYEG